MLTRLTIAQLKSEIQRLQEENAVLKAYSQLTPLLDKWATSATAADNYQTYPDDHVLASALRRNELADRVELLSAVKKARGF